MKRIKRVYIFEYFGSLDRAAAQAGISRLHRISSNYFLDVGRIKRFN